MNKTSLGANEGTALFDIDGLALPLRLGKSLGALVIAVDGLALPLKEDRLAVGNKLNSPDVSAVG